MIERMWNRPGAWRRGMMIGLSTTALGLGGAAVAADLRHVPPGIQAPDPAADPRLIIAPQRIAFQALLTGDMRLSGTLSPAIPGSNALNITIRDRAGAVVRVGRLRLTTIMPGMRMAPVVATLAPDREGYRGVVLLPMFGQYRATVLATTTGGSYSGALTLALLPPAFAMGR